MHELSLCRSVLDILEEQARIQGFRRVLAVRLAIGVLSHVEPEAIRFCFDAVSRDTLAHGAQLAIDRPPGLAWCLDCAREVAIAALYDPCPRCGGHKLEITAGDELTVRELEVD